MCSIHRPVVGAGNQRPRGPTLGNEIPPEPQRPEDFQAYMAPNEGDFWGDPITPIQPGHLRIALLNVDSLPNDHKDEKIGQITEWWERDNINVALFTETGQFWPEVRQEDQWRHYIRDRTYKGIHSNLGYNRHEPRHRSVNSQQYGGTGVFILGDDHHRCDTRGQDESGLGRWTWT